jgi:glycosyltransferase involved in cell wall biosynthesis
VFMPCDLSNPISRVVLTTDAVGGVWQYSLDLARGFGQRNIETVLIVLGPAPSDAQRGALRGIPSLELVESDLPLEWTAHDAHEFHQGMRRLAQLVRRYRPDIVHLNSPALATSSAYDMPVVVVAHSCVATWWRAVRSGPMPDDFAWRRAATRQGLESADQIIAASNSFAAALRATYGQGFEIAVVPNGRNGSGIRRDKRRLVLTAGRLWDEGKNALMLDRAAGHLDVPVFAAGPIAGPDGGTAKFSHLSLLGTLDDAAMAGWHAGAAVFASAARYEPFGLAVLEAAQAGAALVLSDIPSFRELWDEASIFVDVDDERGWIRSLRMLLESADTAARWGAAARARAARYSTDRMVAGTLAAYDHAYRRRRAGESRLREAG